MFWVIIVSYLVGSFPSTFVIGRLLGRPDIRSLGDGNVGSQNVARSYGLKFGFIVFAIDRFIAHNNSNPGKFWSNLIYPISLSG